MLGEQIRNLRKGKGTTLKELAENTGFSIGYLSQLERGLVEPSLSSLRKIAASLDVPAYIFMDYDKGIELTTRRENRVVLRRPYSAVEYDLLSPLPSKDFMPGTVILGFQFQPHEQDFNSPILHDTEEIVLVTSGELTVTVSGVPIVLRAGDTTIIEKNLPHFFLNHTDEVTSGYSVMTPPVWSLKKL